MIKDRVMQKKCLNCGDFIYPPTAKNRDKFGYKIALCKICGAIVNPKGKKEHNDLFAHRRPTVKESAHAKKFGYYWEDKTLVKRFIDVDIIDVESNYVYINGRKTLVDNSYYETINRTCKRPYRDNRNNYDEFNEWTVPILIENCLNDKMTLLETSEQLHISIDKLKEIMIKANEKEVFNF